MRKKKAIHRRFASDMISLVLAPILPASFRNSLSTNRNQQSVNSANDRKSNHNSHNSLNSTDSNHKKVKIYRDDSKTNNDVSLGPSLHEPPISDTKTPEVNLKFDQELDKPIQTATV